MEEEKINQIGNFPKAKNFFKRYRVAFVAFGGLLVLHIGWWRLVETFVPVEQQPKHYAYLAKLDPFTSKEEEEKK